MTRRPRIGLVLGAGGPVGHAWHAGALQAVGDRTGWDPRDAELVVGTSAGAQVGALLRAGMSADDVAGRVTGAPLRPEAALVAQHYNRPDHDAPVGRRRMRPGSFRYLARVASRPWEARPARLAAALLPRGRVPMTEQALGLQRIFGDTWPERRLWVTAVHLSSGRPVAFGHPDAPRTDVGTAVSSSGAVPAVCEPVQVDGEPYIDGGMASPTHLDMLRDELLDLVIVSSPLSMFPTLGWLLRREIRRLERTGTRVVVLEPRGEALQAMRWNPMDLERGPDVVRAARRVVGEYRGLDDLVP